jgi:hypothetical protein
VVQLLTEAYARDDLEQAEFEHRLERAEQARTIEELDALIADFPEEMRRSLESASPEAYSSAGSPAVTGGTAPVDREELEREVTRLDGLAAPTRFNILGDQQIDIGPADPRVVRSLSLIGDCNVDLRDLSGTPGVFLLKVVAVIGDTRIIVPRGTQVEMRVFGLIGDQKHARRGSGLMKRLARKLGLADELDEQLAGPAGPTVVVTGLKLIGDTVIVEE